MRTRSFFISISYFLLALLTLDGCRPRNQGDLKITNGQAADKKSQQYPAVVRIATAVVDKAGKFKDDYKWCTGVWLGEQVILTAEQCVWHPEYGALDQVFVTAGFGSGAQPKSIVRQSVVGPLPPNVSGVNHPLGLAALIFDKGMSPFHVPISSAVCAVNSEVQLIGYGATIVKSSTDMGTKSSGKNKIVKVVDPNPMGQQRFIEIEAKDNGKEAGKSLAVDGDMGSPLIFNYEVQALAVDFATRPDGTTVFNRYQSLLDDNGRGFLNKVATDNKLIIRNLNGKDPLINTPGAHLEVRPGEMDLRVKQPEATPKPTPTPTITPIVNPQPTQQPTQPNVPNTPPPTSNDPKEFEFTDLKKAQAKAAGKKIIAQFSATWCGPCQMMHSGVLYSPSVRQARAGYVFVYLDVDQNPDLAQKYGANSIPNSMVLNSDGSVVQGSSTVGQMSQAGYIQWFKKHMQ